MIGVLGANGEELVDIVWRSKPNRAAVVNVLNFIIGIVPIKNQRETTFGVISRIISDPVVATPPAFSSRNAIGAAS